MGFRLVAGLALVLAVGTPAEARSRSGHHPPPHRAKRWPAIELSHLSTHESLRLAPDRGGRISPRELRAMRHLLRCHHTGREHRIDPRLVRLLYATAHHFGDRSVEVVAGYRAPRVAREKGNPRSPHKRGLACDFFLHGVDNVELRDYLRRAYPDVGVGYYPNSGFVHLDVGRKRGAFWIDYSGPGERARYSSDPEGDLRQDRWRGRPPSDEILGAGPGDDRARRLLLGIPLDRAPDDPGVADGDAARAAR